MTTFSLANTLTEKSLIEFDLFTTKNTNTVNDLITIKDLEASSDLINFVLRKIGWSAFTTVKNGITSIGYGTTNNLNGNGLTEQAAYYDFIEDFKIKERAFKRLMPLKSLSQSQYDGLLSLYFFTDTFKEVGSAQRKFSIIEYIVNREWQWVSSAIALSGENRTVRQSEAKIIMLADYGKAKDRSLIKEEGLQEIRTQYPDRIPTETARRQAEYVYYVETNRFLPKMTEARKRQVVKLTT